MTSGAYDNTELPAAPVSDLRPHASSRKPLRRLAVIVLTTAAAIAWAQPTNDIASENALPGASRLHWDVTADPAISGFAQPFSINRYAPNNQLELKIRSPSSSFRVEILRAGYYQGNGARLVQTLSYLGGPDFPADPQSPCLSGYAQAGSVDCSTWYGIPYLHASSLPSGLYFARVTTSAPPPSQNSPAWGRLIPFVVRDDSATSAILAQTPDTTWQAYNKWTDSAPAIEAIGILYHPDNLGGLLKHVSYNRPLQGAPLNPDSDFGFNTTSTYYVLENVYTTVQWLESIGANVSYIAGRDVDADGASLWSNSLLRAGAGQQRVFMTLGHDEYWSQRQRENVERARQHGIHTAFLSGNDMFWKIRFDDANTFTCGKESNMIPEPAATQQTFTGLWSDGRYNRTLTIAGAENGTTGMTSAAYEGYAEILVSPGEGTHRFWRNTALSNGGTSSFQVGSEPPYDSVGHEWDEDLDNGHRPEGLVHLSSTPMKGTSLVFGAGNPGRGSSASVHHMVIFRNPTSHAISFHAGTISFGRQLSTFRGDPNNQAQTGPRMQALQQAMVNLFADMGIEQPATLGQLTWTPPPNPLPSPPTVSLGQTSYTTLIGSPVVIQGSAVPTTGTHVASVEVNIAGHWFRATGREAWSLEWSPPSVGTFSVLARAFDDFGRPGPIASGTVTATNGVRMYSDANVFPIDIQPRNTSWPWVGTKFDSSVPGTVDQIRIFNPDDRTYEVRIVNLSSGMVVSAGIGGQGPGPWRSISLIPPASIQPNTQYAAIYQASHQRGFGNNTTHFSAGPLYAPPLRYSSGVYSYAASGAGLQEIATGYGVDVVLEPTSYFSTGGSVSYGFDLLPKSVSSTTDEYELGSEFSSSRDGEVAGIRFYQLSTDPGPHYVNLWHLFGDNYTLIASASVTGAGNGWREVLFDRPVRVFAGARYVSTLRTKTGFVYTNSTPSPANPLSYVRPVYHQVDRTNNRHRDDWSSAQNQMWNSHPSYHYPVEPLLKPTAAPLQSVWADGNGPSPENARWVTDSHWTLGTRIQARTAGIVEGIRFFNLASGPFTVRLYDAAGNVLATAAGAPPTEAGTGWRRLRFDTPVSVAANQLVVAAYETPGEFGYTESCLPTDNNPNFGVLQVSTGGGVYALGSGFPTQNYQSGGCYFVDVLFRSHR